MVVFVVTTKFDSLTNTITILPKIANYTDILKPLEKSAKPDVLPRKIGGDGGACPGSGASSWGSSSVTSAMGLVPESLYHFTSLNKILNLKLYGHLFIS